MKRLFAVLFVALTFACNSDDDNDTVDNGLHNPYTGSVVGTWKTIAVYHNDDDLPLGCNQENPTDQDVLFIFHPDNTFSLIHNCGEALPYDSGTYTKTGNVLRLMVNNGEIEEKAHMVVLTEENPDTEEYELALEWRFGIGSGGLLEDYDIQVQKVPDLIID